MKPGICTLTFVSIGLIGLAIAAGPAATQPATDAANAVQAAIATGTATFDHSDWDRLLRAAVHEGTVDYGYLASHRKALDHYLASVATTDLSRLSGSAVEALLINAYNAYTVQSVLNHPGIKSIKEIPGVWTSVTHRVGGFDLTLDTIEHRLLRGIFKDPRIHFVVNCASRSCAPLAGRAFTGARLEKQMAARTRMFLRDRRQVRVEGGKVLVSRYFEWYPNDFSGNHSAPTVAAFIARDAAPEVARLLRSGAKLSFLDYDWSLNGSLTAPAASTKR